MYKYFLNKSYYQKKTYFLHNQLKILRPDIHSPRTYPSLVSVKKKKFYIDFLSRLRQ